MNPIAIPMEDDLVHTPDHPFFVDSSCGCHEDDTLIADLAALVEAGELSPEQASDLVAGTGR